MIPYKSSSFLLNKDRPKREIANTNRLVAIVVFCISLAIIVHLVTSEKNVIEQRDLRIGRYGGEYTSIYRKHNWLIHVPKEYNDLACFNGKWNTSMKLPFGMDQPAKLTQIQKEQRLVPLINVYINTGVKENNICHRAGGQLCTMSLDITNYHVTRACGKCPQPSQYIKCIESHNSMSNFYGGNHIQSAQERNTEQSSLLLKISIGAVFCFIWMMYVMRDAEHQRSPVDCLIEIILIILGFINSVGMLCYKWLERRTNRSTSHHDLSSEMKKKLAARKKLVDKPKSLETLPKIDAPAAGSRVVPSMKKVLYSKKHQVQPTPPADGSFELR